MRKLFPNLIGNENLKKIIARGILSENASHAYILEGPSGSGKSTAALEIASAYLCLHRDFNSHFPFPCGECAMCGKVARGVSPDVKYIGREKGSLGVDAIRLIKEELYIAPNDGDVKIYVIDASSSMTVQAQNALLLSLEEPPPFVKFLILTEDASALLETIRSRAPVIRMQTFSDDFVLDYLRAEFPEAGESKLREAASMSGGSLGIARSLAGDRSKLLEAEGDMRSDAIELVSALLLSKGDYYSKIASLPRGREDALKLLEYAASALRDLLAIKRKSTAPLLCFFSKEEAERLAKNSSSSKIAACFDSLVKSYEDIQGNTSASLSLSCIWLGGVK